MYICVVIIMSMSISVKDPSRAHEADCGGVAQERRLLGRASAAET